MAAPLAFARQGADLVGAPIAGALDPLAWRQALATCYAWTVLAAGVALAFALISLVSRGGAAKPLSAATLFSVGAALAASGHAGAVDPQALMRASVFVPAVTAAFWVGASFRCLCR